MVEFVDLTGRDPLPAPTSPPATAPIPASGPVVITLPSWMRLPSMKPLFKFVVVALVLLDVGNHAGLIDLSRSPIPVVSVVKAPLHATLIYDGDGTTPEATAAAIRSDANLDDALKALDCAWRNFDKDAPTLTTLNLKQFADEAGVPTLIIQAEGTDKPLVHERAPATSADVLAKVKKLRGAK